MIIYNVSEMFKEELTYDLNKYLYWFILNENEISSMPFNIDDECIHECNFFNGYSQINFYNEYTFITLNVLELNGDNLLFKDINIIFGKNYLVTIYRGSWDILKNLINDLRENKNCFVVKNNPKISTLLYIILDRIIINNFSIINTLSSKGDIIEISILKDDSRKNFEKLIKLRGQVYRIKKYLNPIRYIGDALILNENEILNKDDIILFERINNKFQKLILSIENLNQQLSLVREAYESEISNKTNQLMKLCTLGASIFLPLDLITSFFGMSFDSMPLKNCCYSVYIIIVIMCLIVFLLIILFKKKDWL